MNRADPLSFRASLAEYQQEAEALLDALKSGDEAAEWRFKWEHPRFRGKSVADVRAATLDLTDAQVVVAHEYAFETWSDLVAFTDAVRRFDPLVLFETAVEAVISGDLTTLQSIVRANPESVHMRSTRRHHATLLLLDAGEDPSRYNPEGYHSHATPLHQAVWSNRAEVVRLLVERGARLDIQDTVYLGTPVDWAIYGKREAIAECLRGAV